MLTVALAGLGDEKVHTVLPELPRWVVAPLMTTVLPTKSSADEACAVFCRVTSVSSWSLERSRYSTRARGTSCCVNWLLSSGSSGCWFCNCVVSNCRNCVKFWAMPGFADEDD